MAVKVCQRCGYQDPNPVLVRSDQIGTYGSPCAKCDGTTVIKAS